MLLMVQVPSYSISCDLLNIKANGVDHKATYYVFLMHFYSTLCHNMWGDVDRSELSEGFIVYFSLRNVARPGS